MRLRDNPVDNQLQKDMWNGRAGESWVRHNSLLDELLSEPGHRCMALFDLPTSAQVLDVGCGCGNQTLDWAARLDPSCTITGVDISAPMLALAEDLKSANQSSLQANVSFVMGDASEPLFPEASFDAIVFNKIHARLLVCLWRCLRHTLPTSAIFEKGKKSIILSWKEN